MDCSNFILFLLITVVLAVDPFVLYISKKIAYNHIMVRFYVIMIDDSLPYLVVTVVTNK